MKNTVQATTSKSCPIRVLPESEIIPYHLSHPEGERVFVIAPHPDDESIGCGGTISLLLRSNKSVKVAFLTSGEKADPSHPAARITNKTEQITEYALIREKEAVKALRVLGVSDYEFLRFPDRELHDCYERALERLMIMMGQYRPDTIYSPSPVELHPDHRTAAALSLEIQRSSTGHNDSNHPRLAFYEVTTPLRPNALINVSPVYAKKKRALRKYRSQLRLVDYLRHAEAMNTIRALTVSPARYVEAFWVLDRPVTGESLDAWMKYA